ncbi:MAG TPA: hypothetical protein VNW72_09270 [Chthoniobacterales bacterium]|jgi:hypothetical protein|nr:hypothetical protein [Chthoniobacterales bacterium]
MKIDRAWKIGIATSLIGTVIFLYCLDPILRLVSLILFRFSGTLFHIYTDRLFAQAALGVGPDPALYLFTLVLGAVCGFLTILGITIGVVRLPHRAAELASSNRARSRRVWGLIILVLLLDLGTLLILYNTFFQMRIITSFRQHTTAIAPYITDQEMKVILSRWTQMKGEADYNAIYRDLKVIADKNHVVLPDNLVFRATSL